ncbi:hypothetical protein ACS0TY_003364 [Phlomoides rotata]
MYASASQLVDKEEEEIGKIKKENPDETELEDDNCYISPGNLFFDVVLSVKQVTSPSQLYMPMRLIPLLPDTSMPAVLRHGAKNWTVSYLGGVKPRFVNRGWRRFVTQNHLKAGDVCVFELKENTGTNLRFKVHILRTDDLPHELIATDPDDLLLEELPGDGITVETAICID